MTDELRDGITCLHCGLTSWHPDHIRDGWCERCHDWTNMVLITTSLPVEVFVTESIAPWCEPGS